MKKLLIGIALFGSLSCAVLPQNYTNATSKTDTEPLSLQKIDWKLDQVVDTTNGYVRTSGSGGSSTGVVTNNVAVNNGSNVFYVVVSSNVVPIIVTIGNADQTHIGVSNFPTRQISGTWTNLGITNLTDNIQSGVPLTLSGFFSTAKTNHSTITCVSGDHNTNSAPFKLLIAPYPLGLTTNGGVPNLTATERKFAKVIPVTTNDMWKIGSNWFWAVHLNYPVKNPGTSNDTLYIARVGWVAETNQLNSEDTIRVDFIQE